MSKFILDLYTKRKRCSPRKSDLLFSIDYFGPCEDVMFLPASLSIRVILSSLLFSVLINKPGSRHSSHLALARDGDF